MPSYLLTTPAAEPVTLAQAKVAARVDDSAFDAIITARAEIAWIDLAQCHDDWCPAPATFVHAHIAKHYPQPVLSPVPEPGMLPMLLAGVAVLAWLVRRRRVR